MAKSLNKGDCHEPTALAMTVYLRLNLNCAIGTDNPAVAHKHAEGAFEEFFAHIEALLNLLW